MRFVPNWRRVLTRSFSVWALILCAVLGGIGLSAELLSAAFGWSSLVTAGLIIAGSIAGVVGRLIEQPSVSGDNA